MEYSLFQPGLFTDFFTLPYGPPTHASLSPLYFDFQSRRAILVGDGNYTITLTTIGDLAAVVAEAVDFSGEWPRIGGIRGSQITVAELLRIGEELRGINSSCLNSNQAHLDN